MQYKATEKQVADAIRDAHGNVSMAAKILTQAGFRYTRSGLLQRIQRSETLTQARRDADATLCEQCEWTVVRKALVDKDFQACKFILEHRDPRYKPQMLIEKKEDAPPRSSKEIEAELEKLGWRRADPPSPAPDATKQEKQNA